MAILVPCNFAIYVGDFSCACEGIVRFRDEAPFVWYKADENGYCLVWNVIIGEEMAEKIQMLIRNLMSEPSTMTLPMANLRHGVLRKIFYDNVREPLMDISRWKLLWEDIGEDNYNRYFPRGVSSAVRDMFDGYGLSWRRDCENFVK